MSKKEERHYLHLCYLIILFATLTILTAVLGFVYLKRELVRTELFIAAFGFGTVMFLILTIREHRFGSGWSRFFSAMATLGMLSFTILYFIRRFDRLTEGIRNLMNS